MIEQHRNKPIANSLQQFNAGNVYDEYFARMVSNIFENAARIGNAQEGNTEEEKRSQYGVDSDGGYKCIHLYIISFIAIFNDLISSQQWTPKQIEKIRFIDVGCGVGQKIFLAQCFGFKAYGLELRKALIEEGKKAFGLVGGKPEHFLNILNNWECKSEPAFIQGNALTFEDYSNFDVIYFYCPLFKPELQKKLEDKIARTAKEGSIVVPCLAHGVFELRSDYEGKPCASPEAKDLGWEFTAGDDNIACNNNKGYFIRHNNSFDI